MKPRAIAFALVSLLATACSSTPVMELDLTSDPAGAEVYLSRRGERSYQGKLGPIRGDVKAEDLEEGFVYIGTAPLTYTSPLRETESDATVLGVGGKVILEYKDGVVRFQKPGFETVERHVRFQDGEVRLDVEMERAPVAVKE